MSRKREKVGRNEPCPCGSGKKYKRCCLVSPASTAEPGRIAVGSSASLGEVVRAPLAVDSGWPLDRVVFSESAARHLVEKGQIPGYEVHPWVVAQLHERLSKGRKRHGRHPPISRVRAMTTEKIIEVLARCGVTVTAESLTTEAKHVDSAWELSTQWVEGGASATDAEFLGLAACELWKRWLPELPSMEMLDERMQEGYDALAARGGAAACKIWLGLWRDLLARLPDDVHSFEDADAWFPGLNSLGNWTNDLEHELHNASLEDRVLQREGLALFERLVGRFDTSDRRVLFRQQLAHYATRCGDPARGESILRALIVEAPDKAGGYVLLANHLRWRDDVGGAVAVLEEALRRPVDNAADWGLGERLDRLKTRGG